MKQLLRKDWVIYRWPIIAAGILWTVGPLLTWVCWIMRDPNRMGSNPGDYVGTFGVASLAVTVILAAIFGGGAFASERHDRTADFMAMLPVTRGKIIVSKLVISGSCIVLLWLLGLLTCFFSELIYKKFLVDRGLVSFAASLDWGADLMPFLALGIMAFGIAWFFSSLINQAAVAATVSVVITVSLFVLINVFADHWRWFLEFSPNIVFTSLPLLFGITSFVLGTVQYLKRVRP
jgi:ABC-type transport system involved in multi-copper enzyme maturation permease subunit